MPFLLYLLRDPLQESQRPGSILVWIVTFAAIGMLQQFGWVRLTFVRTGEGSTLQTRFKFDKNQSEASARVKYVTLRLLLTDAGLLGTIASIGDRNWFVAWACTVIGPVSVVWAGVVVWYACDQLWYDRKKLYYIPLFVLCLYSAVAYVLFGFYLYIAGDKWGAFWLYYDLGHWLAPVYDWTVFVALVVTTPIAGIWLHRERNRLKQS